jgi:hypothetical protein
MTTSKKKKILDGIHQMIDDVLTNESAVLIKSEDGTNQYDLLSYSKIELEGDSLQCVKNQGDEQQQLNKVLATSTMRNRKAVWTFIQKALS